MHLTDEQLNEYLDNETTERPQLEAHLSNCSDCTARLTALQSLFAELDALPEVELTHSLREASLWDATRFAPQPNLTPQLPRWLTLTATLQAAFALIILLVAAPFVAEVLPPIELPSLTETLLQLQAQWLAWLKLFSALELPALPQIPTFEISSLLLTLTVVGVSLLWLVGNGLLLRKPIR